MSTNIKVCVRVRPENGKERAAAQHPIICVIDESLLMFDPVYDQAVSYFHGRAFKDPTSRKPREAKFAFDRVFSSSATNIEVYEQTTKSVLRSLVEGFNCSVFAYGATGAGKTFSMLGSPQTPGVIFLSMMDLYNIKESEKDERTIDVSVSYLEVYNENIKDLLCPSSANLPIRENGRQGIVIPGLTVRQPNSAEELLQMLEKGNKNRTQHPTDANAESSRSHAVFQVFVRVKNSSAALSQDVKVSKLSLIDLAGSERATVTKNRGARFREGANINKSLLALGNCINALADTKRKGSKHIPYRNSKLTRILKDSLGDNCKTVMLAAVSPSRQSYEDTYNTLSYADRAKKIKAVLRRNVISVNTQVQNYGKVVDDLHEEIANLKKKLQAQSMQLAEYASQRAAATSTDLLCNFDIDLIQTDISKAYGERRQIRDDILHVEMMQRHLSFSMASKQQILDRLDMVSPMAHRAGNKTVSKVVRALDSASTKQQTLDAAKSRESERLLANTEQLRCLIESGSRVDNPHAQTILSLQMKAYHYEQESREWQRQNHHLTRTVNSMQASQKKHERLVQQFVSFLNTSEKLLSHYGLQSDDLANMYRSVKRNIVNERDVTFTADDGDTEGDVDTEHFKSLIQLPVMSADEHSLTVSGKSILPKAASADDTVVLEAANSTFSLEDSPLADLDVEPTNSTFTISEAESPLASNTVLPADSPLACNSDKCTADETTESPAGAKALTPPQSTTSLTQQTPSPVCQHSTPDLTDTPQFTSLRRSPRFTSQSRAIFRPVSEVLCLTKGTGCDELEGDDSPDCPPAKLRVISITPPSSTPEQFPSTASLRHKLPLAAGASSKVDSRGGSTAASSEAMDVDSPCNINNTTVTIKPLYGSERTFADAVRLPPIHSSTDMKSSCGMIPGSDSTFVLTNNVDCTEVKYCSPAPEGSNSSCLIDKECNVTPTAVSAAAKPARPVEQTTPSAEYDSAHYSPFIEKENRVELT